MRKMAAGVRVVGCVLGCCGLAGAQGLPPDYGIQWATIGDPGNRDTTWEETSRNGFPGTEIGGVDYLYRLSRTEVTIGEYFEFVDVYYPFYVKRTGNVLGLVDFTGRGIRAAFGQVQIRDDHSPDQPADMSWMYAARYCNWLHNGKVVEGWAFDTGVYDTSTFVQGDDGVWQHQLTHDPGARFWIPTRDEWVKGGYWDPAKNDGAGGYWQFPNGSDVEPLPGLPGEGGERNAGDDWDVFPLGVGSYPDVQSPWGLLDVAGGLSEYTEQVPLSGVRERRICYGSRYSQTDYGYIFSFDLLGQGFADNVGGGFHGLRLAAPIVSSADLNGDGHTNYFDISVFVRWFAEGDGRADLRDDGRLDIDDVRVFLGLWG